jgi:diguanylate cyclase (GGDEF)-like protein
MEHALTRAGFQLVEPEGPGPCPAADAILITLADVRDRSELLPPTHHNHGSPPRIVVLSSQDPDGAAEALALGAADVLVGTVHLPELCARLYARIREHRQPALSFPGSSAAEAPARSNGRTPRGEESKSVASSPMLDQRLRQELERARRYSLSFSLILLGVDELQSADERIEAEATIRLREGVAETLRRELRVPDLVVPYGPDEFAIVLPETDQAGARQSLIRVRERLTSLPFGGDPRLGPTRFSAGIVTFPHPAAFQADDLFAMAEAALMRGRAQSIERIGVAV